MSAPADEVGKTLERCLLEVEHLRATCKSAQDLKVLEDRARSAENLLVAYKAAIEQQQVTLEQQKGLNALTASQLADYQTQIGSYEARITANNAQIDRLKRDRAHLRKMRNVLTGVVLVLAVSIGVVAAR